MSIQRAGRFVSNSLSPTGRKGLAALILLVAGAPAGFASGEAVGDGGDAAASGRVPFWDGGAPSAEGSVTGDSNLVVGDSGWTTFAPSADTRTIYVSNSAGDDANDGLSPATPKRTIAAGIDLLRHGYPDWLLLLRGDSWQENLGAWRKSGRSTAEPMLVSTYGAATPRPQLRTGNSGGIWTMPGSGTPPTIDYLAIVGLHFEPHTFTGAGDCVGARMLQPGTGFLIEDCVFQGFGTNLVFQAFSSTGSARHSEFAVRRSTIADAHCVEGTGAHPQGLYALGVDGLLVEECVFDHNGWSETVPGAGADIFSHNIYIDNDNSGVVVRGNVIANASSHGMQLRCGGDVVNNLFVRNSIALLVGGGNAPNAGGVRAEVHGNVIVEGKNIDGANPRGWGMTFANVASGEVSHNILAHNVLGTQPSVISLEGDASVNTGAGVGVHDLRIESNVVYNWGGSLFVQGDLAHVSGIKIDRNHFQELTGGMALLEHFDQSTVNGFDASENRFFAMLVPSSGWTQIELVPQSIDHWKSLVGDVTSTVQRVTYHDPDRSVASYNASIGGTGTLAAFLAEARQQSRANWRPEYKAIRVNRYVRRGFVSN